ncbi:MAG: hypothetical protein KDB74_04035 [Flavobacteriales bacterium]|nr:hypothetical protein [Flavobacteriales bacterium]
MKLGQLFILHFRPLENYPPIQNLLHVISSTTKAKQLKIRCISTKGQLKAMNFQGVEVNRFGELNSSKLLLWWTYLWYNFAALLLLIVHRPKQVLYYESLSAFPVILYKRFINPKAKLYIHYHEYTSPAEYDKASPVERYFHRLEKTIYGSVDWISHTNKVRLDKFLIDEGITFNKEKHHYLPNFPSRNWAKPNQKWNGKEPLKIVYVGYSLTEKGSYLSEIVEYLSQLAIKTTLSIFCLNQNDFIKQMEGTKGKLLIKVFDGLAYEELPPILSQQHIGLILYKATTPNYINNAPNKLFEYLSCGLDVWYPQEMLGIHEYKTQESPKVVCIDFNFLKQVNINHLLLNENESRNITYFAENVYSQLIHRLEKA